MQDFTADRERRKQEVDKWISTPEGKKAKELHFQRCPKDGSDLKQTELGHGLEVDDCQLCRGIFLHYGELEDIAALRETERKEIRDRILKLSISQS